MNNKTARDGNFERVHGMRGTKANHHEMDDVQNHEHVDDAETGDQSVSHDSSFGSMMVLLSSWRPQVQSLGNHRDFVVRDHSRVRSR